MRIKRFEAGSMAEALRMIKDEFGPEAVILSVRDLRKTGGLLGFIKNPGVEVTAAVEAESLKNKFAAEDRMADTVKDSPHDAEQPGPLYKQMMQIVKYQRNSPPAPAKTESVGVRPLKRLMLRQCVKEEIVRDLVSGIGKRLSSEKTGDDGHVLECVAGMIEKMGVSACPPVNSQSDTKTLAFVGPTGVGKTTTIAKLAAVYAVRMKKKVAVISVDNDRIGAIEQLGIYARIIGIPMEVASDAKELDQKIRAMKNRDLILIDTPGASPYNEKKIAGLKKTFGKSREIDFHLVASAATKDEDLGIIFDKFRALPIKSVVFTKIDETAVYGAILNQLVRTRIPVSLLGCGQEIPEDLEIATVSRLAGLVMERPEETGDRPDMTRQLSQKSGPAPDEGPPLTHILGAYVGNKNSDIFHHPDCNRVKKIKPENITLFESRADAMGKKNKPCKICCADIAESIELSPGVTEERKFLLKK